MRKAAAVRALDRGGVDDRLEDGARLALRLRRAVELACLVVATADHCVDLAGLRVERHEGRLERPWRYRVSLPAAERLVEHREVVSHRALGGVLQIHVDRRVDPQRLSREVGAGEHVAELALEVVDEVGRVRVGEDPARLDAELLLLDLRGLVRLDEAHLDHRVDHLVAPVERLVGVEIRRVERRASDDAGEQRGLLQAELRDVLVEVRARGLADAVDRVGALLAEEDLVAVELEDLILVEPRLEHDRDERLLKLALVGALGRQEHVLHELLRERRSALRHLAVRDVDPDGARETAVVDPAMLEVAPVLDRDDRVDEVLRQVGVLNDLSLLVLGVRDRGQQLGLDLDRLHGLVRALVDDPRDRLAVLRERDRGGGEGERVVEDRVRSGRDRECDAVDRVAPAPLVGAAVARHVADAVEVAAEVSQRDVLPDADRARLGVDARRANEDVAAQLRVEHAAVLDVEVREDAEPDGGDDAEDGDPPGSDDPAPQALSPESRLHLLLLHRGPGINGETIAQRRAEC